MLADCLPGHEFGVGVGWGGVITYVALAWSLTCYATYLLRDNMRMGWGGVITYVAFASSLTCYPTYLLRDNMRMGWGEGITCVALASSLTCYATYLLRDNMRMGWVGVTTHVVLASSLTCYATGLLRDNMRMGWGEGIHPQPTMALGTWLRVLACENRPSSGKAVNADKGKSCAVNSTRLEHRNTASVAT